MAFHRRVFEAMGCPCEIQVFADEAAAREAIESAIAEVQRLDARYSHYREDSFLTAINQTADRSAAIEVDEETARLIDYIEGCFVQSDGLFDVTAGALTKRWRDRVPSEQDVAAARESVGWRRVHWSAPMLTFELKGMALDFGGVVKEYAADRAAALCRDAGITGGMINLGGDIAIVGPRADGTPWRIGIRHPREPGEVLRSVELNSGALATSGDYERCVEVDGVRYGHIINPFTGWPVRRLASVTVIADLAMVAGSAATIAMLKEEAGPAWLEVLGLPHLWVDVDGAMGGSLVANA